MSQELTLQLLRELGGRARWRDISKLALEKYPDASLYQYVGQRLTKLQAWGQVRKDEHGFWRIARPKAVMISPLVKVNGRYVKAGKRSNQRFQSNRPNTLSLFELIIYLLIYLLIQGYYRSVLFAFQLKGGEAI